VATFLIVRVMDVTGAPVAAQRVAALFSGVRDVTLLGKTSVPGAFEVQIPDGVTAMGLLVEARGFFDVTQALTLSQTGTPTLSFDGAQALNVRNLATHSRDGGGFNVEVFVVVGQLRDASSQVVATATAAGNPRRVSTVPLTVDVGVLGVPILTPLGSTTPSTSELKTIAPRGVMRFVERTTVASPQSVPLNYHLFFHPNIPAHFAEPYPFTFSYMDLYDRYMLQRQKWDIGKAMVAQHDAGGGRCIFIFPIGSKKDGFGDLDSQAAALRLLEEVNYFVQRMDGVGFPLQPVGNCALSGFSAGIRAVNNVLTRGRVARFNDVVLRDIYNFDGVFADRDKSGKEFVDIKATLDFCGAVRSWFRGGDGNRSFRMYSQASIWLDTLKDAAPGATLVTGRDGAREADHPRFTLLFTPSGFWDKSPPAIRDIAVSPKPDELYKSVHQFMPAFFMTHALGQSAIPSGAAR
jgi:hypothetical protein